MRHAVAATAIAVGWQPDPPDSRDLTPESHEIAELLLKAGVRPSGDGARKVLRGARKTGVRRLVRAEREAKTPSAVDLREWCPPTRYQGLVNTCASHVVAGLLEYFEKRTHGISTTLSRRFLHRVAMNFAQAEGTAVGQGAYIRQVFGVLCMLGVTPEKYFPYPAVASDGKVDLKAFEAEPSAFCYALARDYRAIQYYRLDPRDDDGKLTISADELLDRVRSHLTAGIPTTLGMPLYQGVIQQSLKTGLLPYPSASDKQVGMHAVMVAGYDDTKVVNNTDDTVSHKGALLLQNSWGADWGDKGFGWLAYDYVRQGRTSDLWALLSADWIDTDAFQLAVSD